MRKFCGKLEKFFLGKDDNLLDTHRQQYPQKIGRTQEKNRKKFKHPMFKTSNIHYEFDGRTVENHALGAQSHMHSP